jgi:hypothetical protein
MIYQSLTLRPGILTLVTLPTLLFLSAGLTLYNKLRTIRRHLKQDAVVLELTPPPSPQNTILATEDFFRVLSQELSFRSWQDMIRGRKNTIALEVVSTRPQGIRYLVRMPRHDLPTFLHNLSAFAPTVTATETTDYLATTPSTTTRKVLELYQTGNPHCAIRHQENDNDPIAYVTNAISQLDDDELISLQLVLSPASSWYTHVDKGGHQTRQLIPTDIISATDYKSQQPQFQASFRVLLHTATAETLEQRTKGICGALSSYTYEGYQSIRPRLDVPGWFRRYRFYAFRHRLPALMARHACLLASSELAALYHFPYGTTNQTEDMQLAHNATLPVPLPVKNTHTFDVQLGENSYRGRTTPIGLSAAERQRHMYIVGGTGNGKSTLLQYAIVQDITAGKGVAVIDPHGDLAENITNYIPLERIDDVIYFDPSDLSQPIGLNLLELTPGLSGDALLHEKDIVTESIVSMFRKIFATNDTTGHRIEYVLRNTVQTALTLEGATLFTVYDLLNDASYRKRIMKQLENKDLRLFWREFSRAGSFQQVSMAAGVTAKIGRFLFSASARRILEQPTSAIDFTQLMNDGKILICNLSKGKLGEDTSELFGIMLLAKLQLATLRRAYQETDQRPPFYVYVDEFQSFATTSFVQLLSEARKYGLFLTMAEQSTSQQSDRRMIDIVFANVGTVISFRTSSQQDEHLLQPLFSPYVEAGTLGRLPAYTFFIRIAAEQSLPPFSGRTVLLGPPADELTGELVIQASRMRYGRSAPLAPATPPERAADSQPLAPVLGLLDLADGSS